MCADLQVDRKVRFGPYEFDPLSGDLRKQGLLLKLQPQPARVLAVLLSRPGEVVLREELRKAIWGTDTFVNFERGLNFAIRQIRATLDDDWDTAKYIETVPRRGYRFVGPIELGRFSVEGVGVTRVDLPSHVPAPQSSRWRQWLLVAAIPVLLVMVWIGSKSRLIHGTRTLNPVRVRSIAVLPLRNLSGDPDQEYFADGMTDELITALAEASDLRVVSRTSVMRFKVADKPLSKIAKDLNVEEVVEGTVFRSNDHVRITAQLIDAQTDSHLWAKSYERELKDVLGLQNEIAHSISYEVKATLRHPGATASSTTRSLDVEAYDDYLKGRYECSKRTPGALRKCTQLLEQSVSKDPTFAKGYSGLSTSYVLLGEYNLLPAKDVYPKARSAAAQALEWDSTLAEAHSALAAVYRDYDWDWAASEREFRQAIALNPADSMAHQWYAELLSEVLGRHDEAIAEIKRAEELDLLSPITNTILGRTLLFAGQVDAAVLQLQTTVDMNPTFAHAHFMLGNAYLEKGLVDKAVKEFSAASTLAPDMPRYASALAYSYARRGDRKQARDLLGKLAAQSAVGHSLWFDRAVIYTGLGERDIALAYLERARADHDPRLRWLPMEPFFESLRSDPRFKNLEDRLSLTAS